MDSKKIQQKVYVTPRLVGLKPQQKRYAARFLNTTPSADSVSFTGNLVTELPKRGWLGLRKLSAAMESPSEMTNSLIAAVGTACIAPFGIMVSPLTEEEKKKSPEEIKEKKGYQAKRQPVSAALALLFQLPTTIGINKGFKRLAYVDQIKFFNDDTLGTLVPDKKYLEKIAKKYLKGKLSGQELIIWENVYKPLIDPNFKNALRAKLREDYDEIGISISDKKLDKMVNSRKRQIKFLAEDIAGKQNKALMAQKIAEFESVIKARKQEIADLTEQIKLMPNGPERDALRERRNKLNKITNIKHADLVTDEYKDLAKQRFKAEYEMLETNAKLNIWDKFVRSVGFKTKNLKKLEKQQEIFKRQKGLELLQKDEPDVFRSEAAKLKKFVETRNKLAQDVFKNKIFWVSLLTNLGMVAISCVALNWLHPRFVVLLDEMKAKKEARRAEKEQKVEVA